MTDLTATGVARSDVSPYEPLWTRRTAMALGVLALLVALADVLFYPHEPGISLTLFLLALVAGVAALHWKRAGGRRALVLLACAVLAALPFAEYENIFWVPFAFGAASLYALEASGRLGRFEDWAGPVLRFAALSPMRAIADGVQLLGEAADRRIGGGFVRLALVWVVPVVCAGVFAFLFVAANPVLEDAFHAIRFELIFRLLDPLRVCIWGVAAAASWPVLSPRLMRWAGGAAWQGPVRPRPEGLLIGGTAMRNGLVAFNALFAVQTGMDLMYLWGGVRLPDGLSYADYAHRGAYPLIVTALLAAAFVLVAMRKNGPGERSAAIRTLVYVWIAQNIWLVVSSIFRLKLYVEAYGLSEMRIAAGVWMGLVAAGLVLIVAKIAFGRSNRWLVMANLAALMLTLWGVAFLNVPASIATFNVEHCYEVTGRNGELDEYYMGDLGPEAIPALDEFLRTARLADADKLKTISLLRDNMAEPLMRRETSGTGVALPVDWQSWTWRGERLRRYLEAQVFAPEARAARN